MPFSKFENKLESITSLMAKVVSEVYDLSAFSSSAASAEKEAAKNSGFKFSFIHKNSAVDLLSSQVVVRLAIDNGFHRIAMVEPPLNLAAPEKICFRINKATSWLGVGLCLKDTVVKNKYDCFSTQFVMQFKVSTCTECTRTPAEETCFRTPIKRTLRARRVLSLSLETW